MNHTIPKNRTIIFFAKAEIFLDMAICRRAANHFGTRAVPQSLLVGALLLVTETGHFWYPA
jgi:hypothetical protein